MLTLTVSSGGLLALSGNTGIQGGQITAGGNALTIHGVADATLNSYLAGTAGVVKSGPGTVTLGKKSLNTGITTVNNGRLVLNGGANTLIMETLLNGVTTTATRGDCPTIPELLHFAYQMMFFLITPGLFIGAFAERMKFSAMLIFSLVWSLVVYVPCCYGVWHKAGAFLGLTGVIDLAGGIVVHITAGVAALVLCIVVGPRKGFPTTQMLPHNLPLTLIGAGMLWVGWFGFNAGSQLAANGSAAMTLIVTHISACTAAIVWMAIEWVKSRQPSALGIATGSIAGLAAITPAAGKVGPIGAICIGTASAIICWIACAKLKKKFRYDDSLDVFGVHGVGGFVGTILVAVFGSTSFAGGLGDFEIATQLKTQILAALYTTILSGVASYIILKVIALFIPLRVNSDQESQGLDLAEHGEAAYND
jgi:Amt family ammonium transporter